MIKTNTKKIQNSNNQKKIGLKRITSIVQLFLYNFTKLKKAISFWVLFILSLLLFAFGPIYVFYLSGSVYNNLLKNYNYIFLVFENIILILFILLLVNNLFSSEIENGTYLLILSRSFSRMTIFIVKIISLWIITFIFLLLISVLSVLSGFIINLIFKSNLFFDYLNIIKSTFIYSCAITLFSSSAIVFISSFLSSHSVLLIVVIFCSLFLVGGMPYALITSLENNIYLNFDNSNTSNVQKMKTSLLFNQQINEKKQIYSPYNFEYKELTSSIYNFINGLNANQVFNIKSFNTDDSDLNDYSDFYNKFYNFMGNNNLLNTNANTYFSEDLGKKLTIEKWNDQQMNNGYWQNQSFESASTTNKININSSKDIILSHTSSRPPLKTGKEIEQDINNNNASLIEKELYYSFEQNYKDLYNYTYMNWNSNNAKSSLVLFYSPISPSATGNYGINCNFVVDNWGPINEKNYPPNFYLLYCNFSSNASDINKDPNYTVYGGQSFINSVSTFFNYNILQYYLAYLVSQIANQYYQINNIDKTVKIKNDENYIEYNTLNSMYNLVSKFNLIEHWNQLWSSFFAPKINTFFDFYNLNLNYNKYNNQLISYADFPINFNSDGTLNFNLNNFLPLNILLISYMTVSVVCILGSALIFKYKTIN